MKTRDVLISGGGIPGLVLGCLLGQAGLDVAIVEPASIPKPSQIKPSARTSALMNDSLDILDCAGLWTSIEPHSTDLRTLSILDHGIRADFGAEEIGCERFGCNIINALLQAHAAKKFTKKSDLIKTSLSAYSIEDDVVGVSLENGESLRARLLIGADGRNSRVREIAGIRCRDHDYGQMAITALLNHSQPHHFTSTEFHRPGGPFTLVPMPGNTSSLVWLEPAGRAEDLLRLSKQDFEQVLQDMSEGILGAITLASTPTAWPLRMMQARSCTADRVVLIAEAAHVLSPIGAQGLNLSLRDSKTLADLIIEAKGRGLDIGSRPLLSRYEKSRHGDTNFRVTGTHALNQMVASSNPVVASLRRLGLQVVANLPPLRRLAMQRGLTGSSDQGSESGRTTRAKVRTSTR